MAPLAGKPPFATDEPDSFYETPAPQRRVRQPAPPNPNSRTSAYNVYDNYLSADNENADRSTSRQSGVGALGMGLMNLSDSDDDSDDEGSHKKPTPASKNAALAAATRPIPRSPPASLPEPSSREAAQIQPQQTQQQQPTIAAPRPGYAAPIAALNLARPETAASTRSPPLPMTALENPFEPPMAQVYNPRRSPVPPSTSPTNPPSAPHPLQAPITPITPVFARPVQQPGITFTEPIPRVKPVIRGAGEETLLPRRGEKGDDFWRRFSMVAKIENGKPGGSKESWWLKKTQNGSSRLSRWVWVIALLLILCIVGASVLGWKASQSKPAHQAPAALGGSANERPVGTSSGGPAPSGASGATSSIKHVSPTHTVARREAQPTGVAVPLGHARERRRRLFDAVVAH